MRVWTIFLDIEQAVNYIFVGQKMSDCSFFFEAETGLGKHRLKQFFISFVAEVNSLGMLKETMPDV